MYIPLDATSFTNGETDFTSKRCTVRLQCFKAGESLSPPARSLAGVAPGTDATDKVEHVLEPLHVEMQRFSVKHKNRHKLSSTYYKIFSSSTIGGIRMRFSGLLLFGLYNLCKLVP